MAAKIKYKIDRLNNENQKINERIKRLEDGSEEISDADLKLLAKRAEQNNARLKYLCQVYPIKCANEDNEEKWIAKIVMKSIRDAAK